MNPQRQISKAS